MLVNISGFIDNMSLMFYCVSRNSKNLSQKKKLMVSKTIFVFYLLMQ